MSRTAPGVRRARSVAMAATCAVATLGLVTPALASPTTAGPATTSAAGAVPMQMVDPIEPDSVFISEFHYDNDGTDVGEFIEVQGPVGTDLTGWSLVLYNGSNAPGAAILYGTDALPSPIPAAGVVVVDYPANGIQNGESDGIALVDADGDVVEFLSYEGAITAGDGPAAGIDSTDVGVSEPGSTPIGQSLQRIDGLWTGPLENSKGVLNAADDGGGEPGEPVEASLGDVNANWATMVDSAVTTRGVVTAVYPTGGFNGYTIQTAGTGGDTDLSARTASDGIFVYSPSTVDDLAIGDLVEVTGDLSEYSGLREITVEAGAATVLDEEYDAVVPIPDFVMPADEADRIVFQNMLVTPTDYVISDTYDLGGWGDNGFGSLLLGHRGPLIQETDVARVGTPEFAAVVADNAARAVTLDDGRSERTGTGLVPYLSATTHDIRTGVGVEFDQPVVVDYRFQWNFQPTAPQIGAAPWLSTVGGETRAANAAPQNVGGDFQIATFNVLNYFTTLGEDVPGCTAYTDREGNPLTVRGGCAPRGAWDEASFDRQEGKIVDAINGLGAEVVVLQEIENDAATLNDETRTTRDDSLAQLVEALNADAGAGTWDYVPSPAPADQPVLDDQDVIRPAFIYQPAALNLETETSTILVGSAAFSNAREPEGAVFSHVGNPDYEFAVVASHFKSKGSCPDGVEAGPEGCWNDARVAQAEAMADFSDAYAADHSVDDVFLAGDFNSYTMEDPILAFADDGYDVIDNGETSYVYDGKIGSLDHVLANDSAMDRVTGSDIWAINAEESVLGEYSRYNYTESDLFQGDNPFRSSDHNPAIVGVDVPAFVLPYTGPIDIYSINDFHGRIEASPYDGGGAEAMACVVDNARADNPEMLFVSGGDNVGASTFVSAVQQDQPTIDVLNEMGLDASAIGNHEFDQGQADLNDRIIPAADWDYLAANIFDGTGPDAAHAYEPYVIEEVDGIRVAFIGGITTELHSLVNPDGIEGLDIRNLSASINAVADQLIADGAADLIIPVVHDGAASGDFSDIGDTSFGELLDNAGDRFDAVISGHTHKMYFTDVDGMWVTQTGSYGANLGHLTFNVENGQVVGNEFEMISLGTSTDPIECTPVTDMPGNVADIVAAAQEEADELGSVPVGEITADFNRARQSDGSENRGGESTIGNFIADVHLWAGEQAGAQIAFMNPGGIRADLLYDAQEGVTGDADGLVTYQEAAEVQPFANTLMTATLTGEQIIAVLEQQWQPADASRAFLKLGVSEALTYTYDPDAPAGEHITQVWFEGAPLDPAGEYVVIGNSFLMAGGDNFTVLAEGADPADTGRTDLAATVDWFKENTVASPDYRQRAVGVSWVSDPAATYSAGDEVTFDVSSWAFSTNEPKPASLTVSLGDAVLGTFDVDDAIVDGTDEVGRAHVTFTLPEVAGDGVSGYELVLSDDLGTTATVAITIDAGAGAGGGADDEGNADAGGNGNGPGALPDTGVDPALMALATLTLIAAGAAVLASRRRGVKGGGGE
ncbi:ExeM/NucH family extracellular endonuclease [Pseudactinotalea sp. HY158]|nr:ExeM/NucH family extracellular endonuclease [Pseudactinotalea sp. HY158]